MTPPTATLERPAAVVEAPVAPKVVTPALPDLTGIPLRDWLRQEARRRGVADGELWTIETIQGDCVKQVVTQIANLRAKLGY